MPDAQKEFGELFREIAHLWRQCLDARLRDDAQLRPFSLSLAKRRVLLRLRSAPDGLSQRQLAEQVGVEGPTMVGLVDRLEAGGLVERRACATDRRSKIVHLLPAGQRLTPSIEDHANWVRNEVLRGISEKDLQQCNKVLVVMQDALLALTHLKKE